MRTQEVYDRYASTHFQEVGLGLSLEQKFRRFEDWYYDCLPADRDAEILDFGCGAGQFLAFLGHKGYSHVRGLEISREQAELARASSQAEVTLTDKPLEYLARHAERFDVITMHDVIEHLPKDEVLEVLQAIWSALKPGGALLVSTANAAALSGAWTRYIDFTHATGWTEPSLKQVLRLAGFDEVRFVRRRYRLRPSLRHLLGILAKKLLAAALRLAYFVESPYSVRPTQFETKLAALAVRPEAAQPDRTEGDHQHEGR